MGNFYEKYVNLCAKVNKSPSKVAEEIGFSRTSPHGWKRGKQPSDANLIRISAYFNVPTDYFSENEQKNKLVEENSNELEIEKLITMFSALSPEEQKQTLSYMKFQISQRNK